MGVSGSSEGDLRFFKAWKEGRGGTLAAYNKVKNVYAAAQYTMLKAKPRKLLLIKSVQGC